MNQKLIDFAAVMTQMFLFGLIFSYNSNFQELEEIVKRTLKAIKVNQNDSKPEVLFLRSFLNSLALNFDADFPELQEIVDRAMLKIPIAEAAKHG